MRNDGRPFYRTSKDTWYVWHNGQQKSLAVKGKRNEREALKIWVKLLTDSPLGIKKPERVSVSELVDAFLENRKTTFTPESHKAHRNHLAPVKAKFGSRRAESLQPYELEAFARGRGWSSSTQNTVLGITQTMFRWAERIGMISGEPLKNLQRPPMESRGHKTTLTPEQFEKLYRAALEDFQPFLWFIYLTGCRPIEAANLTAEMVDWGNSLAILTEHKTSRKTGKPRVIYLNQQALELLQGQVKRYPEGFLFRNACGRKWKMQAWGHAIKTAREKAGLPDTIIAYGLRHAFATDALSSGVPDAHVAALLGHSGTVMLHKHYSHLTSQSKILRQAAEKVRNIPVKSSSTTNKED